MQPDFSVETTLGAGRNCIVFDELRLIAYREAFAFKCDGNLETFQARLERVATRSFPTPSTIPGALDCIVRGAIYLAAFQHRELL